MHRPSTAEVGEIVRRHKLWLKCLDGGEPADFSHMDLSRVNFRGVDLRKSEFVSASLRSANLNDCHLEMAFFHDADLEKCSLRGAHLRGAKMDGVRAPYADFSGADLYAAILFDADLHHANFSNACISRADFLDADITGADFSNTSMSDAQRSSTAKKLRLQPGPREALGVKHRVARALAQVDRPMQAAAFKRAFPDAFPHVQRIIRSGKLHPQDAQLLIQTYGLTWIVEHSRYRIPLQRISSHANDVLVMCIDKWLLFSDPDMQSLVNALEKYMEEEWHPRAQNEDLFAIGWVRYIYFEPQSVILVEEIQSDVPWLKRRPRPDMETALIPVLKPFLMRFYEDALAIIFDIAQAEGATVEMLTKEDKENEDEFPFPLAVYSKLPRTMGMKKTTNVLSPVPVDKVWQYKPNFRRNAGGWLPSTFTWRRA